MKRSKKNWYSQWWAIVIFVVVGLIIIGSGIQLFSSIMNQVNSSKGVWDKSSEYTMDDCYEVCDDVFDIQLQSLICQGACDVYGKPSESLDGYVNKIKESKDK